MALSGFQGGEPGEFIPIKPLAATGSGGRGSYAGHSRSPSRHHGRPASTGGFDNATTLDTTVDMLDPQSAIVEHLVGSLLRQWQFRARWFLGRHEDLHLGKGEGHEAQVLQQPAPGR
jgi:hypothetical protein